MAGMARGSDPGPNRRSGDEDPRLITASMDDRERRERRQSAIKSMSMTGGLAGLDALSFNEDDFKDDDTGIKKMWTVMTKAKESGMTVDQIFTFFKSTGGEIGPLDFQEGLAALGPAITKTITEDELSEIFQDLDDDGGGTIDIDEFKAHCYNIPRLAWKAEKIRYEREKTKSIEDAAKMAEREATNLPLTPSGSTGAIMHALEDHHHQKDGAAAANMQSKEVIYEGTKLFWRTHEKIDIVMHEYSALHCIVMCSYNATTDEAHPNMIINKTMIEDTIEDEAVQEQLSAQRQEYCLRKQIVGRKLTDDEEAEVAESVRRGILSNYILLRLQQRENPATGAAEAATELFLKKLHLDTYEEGSLIIENPGIATMPLPPEKKEKVNVAEFRKMNAEIRRSSQELGRLSMSAKRMSSIVAASMDAFGGGTNPAAFGGISALNVTTRSGTAASIAVKQKVMRALLRSDAVRDVRRRKVAAFREYLANSLWYEQLCQELLERNASLAAEDKEGVLYEERGVRADSVEA